MAIVLAGALMLAVAVDDAEVQQWAVEAAVDPVDLAGAVNTTGMDPHTYLVSVGELAPPKPAEPAYSPVWDRLAQCESGGDWHARTGNGYYGGLQEDLTFWRSHGGATYASRPDLASKAQQIDVAERGLRLQGWQAWPACSRRLGLR